MALRKDTNPREMDLQPGLQEILLRNGMQAHIVVDGSGYKLLVQGHDSPLMAYGITERQMLALTDWGSNRANKLAYNTFAKVVADDFYLPRDFVHARNAGGRVNMGLNGYRIADGEYGFHLRRVGGRLFYAPTTVVVPERYDGRMKPGELQSGGYGFYWKGTRPETQRQQDALQSLGSVDVTPTRQRTDIAAIPYNTLVTSPVYFSSEKWLECLQSHGIVIDKEARTLTVNSASTGVALQYGLSEAEANVLTSNSIKTAPIKERLEILNSIIRNDFAENVTMAHLNSTLQIDLAMTPELQQELQQQQLTANNGGQELSTKGDAMVYGQDLDSITADKGWYRECEHGREVDVGQIYVQRIAPEQGKNEKDAKYTMTAVINGQAITHEIRQKDYDKFLAVDDYHRMKLFSKIFKEVDMKNRPGTDNGIGAKILTALSVGAVVTGVVAGVRHHGHEHDDHRVFFKPGVDSPNDVAARNFDMQMNMHDRGGHSIGR